MMFFDRLPCVRTGDRQLDRSSGFATQLLGEKARTLMALSCHHLMVFQIAGVLLLAGCASEDKVPAKKPEAARRTQHPRMLVRLESRTVMPSLHTVSPDASYAIGQTGVETIAYDLRSRKEIGQWPSAVSQWSFSADSDHLLRLEADTVSVLSSQTLDALQRWKANPRLPPLEERPGQLNACISPDGQRVAISNLDGGFLRSEDADLLILNTATGRVTQRLAFPIKRPEPPRSFAWKLDFVGSSSRLLVTQDAYVLKQSALINVDDGRVLHRFAVNSEQREASKGSVIAAAKIARRPYTSPVGQSESSEVSFVDLATGDELRRIDVAGTLRDFDIDPSGSELIASVQQPGAAVPPMRDDTELDKSGRLTVLQWWNVRSGKMAGELSDFEMPVSQVRYGAARWNCFIELEYPAGIDDDLDHQCRWIRIPSGERLDAETCFSDTIASDLHNQLFCSTGEKQFFIQGGDVCEFDLPTGKRRWSAEPRGYPSQKASFSPDGKFCWFDHTLTQMVNGYQREWHALRDVQFLDDGQRIFNQWNNGVGIASLATGEMLWRRRCNWNLNLLDSAASGDGRYIALALRETRSSTSDRAATRLVLLDREDEDHPRWIQCDARKICFGPNEQTLIVAAENSLRQIDFASLEILQEYPTPPGEPLDLACGSDGNHVLVAGQASTAATDFRSIVPKGWLVAFDLAQDSGGAGSVGPVHRSDTPISCVAVSADGKSIAAANRASDTTDSEIWVWNWPQVIESNSWDKRLSIRGHRLGVNDVAFHPDGEMLLSAADDGAILWDVREPIDAGANVEERQPLAYPTRVQLVETANWHSNRITPEIDDPEAAFSGNHVSGLEMDHNDRYVLINDNGARIIMLDASNGKELARYPDGRQLHTVASLAANGRYVAEAKKFRSQVTLRDPSTLDPIETIDTIFPVTWLRWTPNSDHLIVGQSYGEGMELVMCWNVASREEVWTLRMPEAREIEFDQTGNWMLVRSGGYHGQTILCRPREGTIAAVFLPTYTDSQQRLILSKTGGTVHQGSEDSGVVWQSP